MRTSLNDARSPSPISHIEWAEVAPTGALPARATQYPPFRAELLDPRVPGREICRFRMSDRCDLSALPTLGCFYPGYLLAVPTREALSFAGLDKHTELPAAQRCIENWREQLSVVFGETILAEHGSAPDCYSTAACISQAHSHLIPMPGLGERILASYINVGGAPDEQLNSLADLPDLVGEHAYILLSTQVNRYLLWIGAERFERQFVRRVTAELLGIPEAFNWKEYSFSAQMEQTSEFLRSIPAFNPTHAHDGVRTLWRTPYDVRDDLPWKDNPHVSLFGCADSERLLFFAACRASGIAEEALDGLTRLYRDGRLGQLDILRAAACARSHLRVHFDTCVSRAAFDFLITAKQRPFNHLQNPEQLSPRSYCYSDNAGL